MGLGRCSDRVLGGRGGKGFVGKRPSGPGSHATPGRAEGEAYKRMNFNLSEVKEGQWPEVIAALHEVDAIDAGCCMGMFSRKTPIAICRPPVQYDRKAWKLKMDGSKNLFQASRIDNFLRGEYD